MFIVRWQVTGKLKNAVFSMLYDHFRDVTKMISK
nr:MAG TPA: hypothetical protein [Caudoviricetes sp.]